ncbi:MAG: hypothetical protein J6C50_04685 [Rickettsiales bacterium]|nr:hypothetical protein [Rickettsiales bacterium]
MYNITNMDQQYILQEYDKIGQIIEDTTDCMNSNHILSSVHLCFAEMTTLLHHESDISRFKDIREKIGAVKNDLNNFYRSNCIDISINNPKLFSSRAKILSMIENFENDLDIEISYRSGNYTYKDSTSAEHPVFTYKNTMEVLDGIYNYK